MFGDNEDFYSCFSGTGNLKFSPVTNCVTVDAVYWTPRDTSRYRRWRRELIHL